MNTRTPSQLAVAVALYAVAAVPVVILWLFAPGVDGYRNARYVDLVHGTALRPYVARPLMPWAIRGVSAVISPVIDEEPVRKWVKSMADGPGTRFNRRFRAVLKSWRLEGYVADYVAGFILAYLLLVALGVSVRALLFEFYDTGPLVGTVFGFLAIACLPVMFGYNSYVYDLPVPIFAAWSLILIARRAMGWFYPVYLLGVLNKETMILLPLVFWLASHGDESYRKQRRLHLAVMAAVFVAIQIFLRTAYAGNPGGTLEHHFLNHNVVYLLTHKYFLPQFVAWGAVALAIFHEWRGKPLLLRQSMFMLVPLVGMSLFFGYLDELRDYYEVFPAAIILIGHSVCRVLDVPLRARQA